MKNELSDADEEKVQKSKKLHWCEVLYVDRFLQKDTFFFG